MSKDSGKNVKVVERAQDKVRSLWVPLRGMNLLLPNMAVSEISSYRAPVAVENAPEWFLGMVRWRDQDIPVISLESVCGLTVPLNPVFSRLMIVNSVNAKSSIKHFAIVTAGLPGLIQFGEDTADEVGTETYDALKCVIRIGNEEAVIPDLRHLQGMLDDSIKTAA